VQAFLGRGRRNDGHRRASGRTGGGRRSAEFRSRRRCRLHGKEARVRGGGRGHSRGSPPDPHFDISALQFELGEGPCVDTMATFHPTSQVDLTADDAHARWPAFAPAVASRGFAAAFAFPLLDGGVAVGTFDVYNRTAGPLDASQTADVSILADLATLAVAQSDTALVIEDVGIAVEPAAPWAHAPIVHNACGMLSQQLGISVDDALLRLRALAFVQNRTVTQLARAVVTRQVKIDPWTIHE